MLPHHPYWRCCFSSVGDCFKREEALDSFAHSRSWLLWSDMIAPIALVVIILFAKKSSIFFTAATSARGGWSNRCMKARMHQLDGTRDFLVWRRKMKQKSTFLAGHHAAVFTSRRMCPCQGLFLPPMASRSSCRALISSLAPPLRPSFHCH